MIYRINREATNSLLSLPESGMGYQIIQGQTIDSAIARRFVVYNGELIVDHDVEFSKYKQQIVNRGYSASLIDAKFLYFKANTVNLAPISSIREVRAILPNMKSDKRRHVGGRGAQDSPKEFADGQRVCVRVSAFENDRRIDFLRRRLREGSFTTTIDDYNDCVEVNDDPIDRYALPNDEAIKWAFYIRPKFRNILQEGVVQPAFGHDGGGIEVYFESGTSDETYMFKEEYGK